MAQIQATDFNVNLLQALLWEYNEAEHLEGLLRQKQAWYDANQTEFWANWVRDVFDLKTANEFGLSVWAIILNQRLYVNSGVSNDKPIFGFDTQTHGAFSSAFSSAFATGGTGPQYFTNFFDGTFGDTSGGIVGLTLDQRRFLLRMRYFNLTMAPTVPNINKFMAEIFAEEGQVYVLDGNDMTAVYVFTFQPSKALLFVLENFDILPRPAGVEVRIVVTARKSFGFGDYNDNFENGNFGA